MEQVDRLGQVVDGLDRPDPPTERDRRVEADDAGLVLEIELDCIDATRVDEVEDPAAKVGSAQA